MELLKWLNYNNRLKLLELLNDWWHNENIPEALMARVVPIYIQGNTDNAENYSPYFATKFLLQNLYHTC